MAGAFFIAVQNARKAAAIEDRAASFSLWRIVPSVVFIVLLMTKSYGHVVCSFLVEWYPFLVALRELSMNPQSPENSKKWALYWMMVVAGMYSDEYIQPQLPDIYPYCLIKALFMLWCYVPVEQNGTRLVYHWFLQSEVETPVKKRSLSSTLSQAPVKKRSSVTLAQAPVKKRSVSMPAHNRTRKAQRHCHCPHHRKC